MVHGSLFLMLLLLPEKNSTARHFALDHLSSYAHLCSTWVTVRPQTWHFFLWKSTNPLASYGNPYLPYLSKGTPNDLTHVQRGFRQGNGKGGVVARSLILSNPATGVGYRDDFMAHIKLIGGDWNMTFFFSILINWECHQPN